MKLSVVRRAQQRRALFLGLGISAVAHAAIITYGTMPGAPSPVTDAATHTAAPVPDAGIFDGIRLVRIAEPSEAPASASSASRTYRTASAAAASSGRLGTLLAELQPVAIEAASPRLGTPVAFAELRSGAPIAMASAEHSPAAGSDKDRKKKRGRGWGAIFGGIGVTVSGGGVCAAPAGGS